LGLRMALVGFSSILLSDTTSFIFHCYPSLISLLFSTHPVIAQIMKNRIRFSWFVKKDTKLRKRSGLPVNPNPPPLTSPSTAPAESQVTIATVPLAPAKEPSQAPDPDKEPSQVPDLGKESSQNEMPLDCMWAEAAKEFERICGDSLSNGDIKNFDDVKKQIEQQNLSFTEADADSKTKWEKAKGMGLETLKYLGAILPAASIAGSLASYNQLMSEEKSAALTY
jgi:hypothetical protein